MNFLLLVWSILQLSVIQSQEIQNEQVGLKGTKIIFYLMRSYLNEMKDDQE